jgi:hypothetical protein
MEEMELLVKETEVVAEVITLPAAAVERGLSAAMRLEMPLEPLVGLVLNLLLLVQQLITLAAAAVLTVSQEPAMALVAA